MSLDELVAMRQKEAKAAAKKKKPVAKKTPRGAAGGPKGKGKQASKQAVSQQANKLKREAKANARRGLGGPKQSQADVQMKARKAVAAKRKGGEPRRLFLRSTRARAADDIERAGTTGSRRRRGRQLEIPSSARGAAAAAC